MAKQLTPRQQKERRTLLLSALAGSATVALSLMG